jgi:hypothetical protein
VSEKRNGLNRWPSAAVVKPERTTTPSRSTSHGTLASNAAASPVTVNVLGSAAPSLESLFCTSDRVASGSARWIGSPVTT